MLQHVVEVKVLDLVLGRVDLGVAVFEIRLDHECGWIAILAGRRMVRASITTLRLDERDVAVVSHDFFDESRQFLIHKVNDDAHAFGLTGVQSLLGIAGHVLLEHGLDISFLRTVGLENSLGTKKSTFLCRVPVEFQSIIGLAFHNIL